MRSRRLTIVASGTSLRTVPLSSCSSRSAARDFCAGGAPFWPCAQTAAGTTSRSMTAAAIFGFDFITSKPPVTTRGAALGAAAEEDRLHGLEQDDGVEQEALVLDVVEVVLQLLPRVLDRRAVGVLNLRPARQAGRDEVALLVEGNLLCELFDEVRPFGARADEVHLAAQDVPELRYLVHANLAYHAPDA